MKTYPSLFTDHRFPWLHRRRMVWAISRALDVPCDPAAELERLQEYVHWVKERWYQAQVHDYDDDMKDRFRGELQQAVAQLNVVRQQVRLGDKAIRRP